MADARGAAASASDTGAGRDKPSRIYGRAGRGGGKAGKPTGRPASQSVSQTRRDEHGSCGTPAAAASGRSFPEPRGAPPPGWPRLRGLRHQESQRRRAHAPGRRPEPQRTADGVLGVRAPRRRPGVPAVGRRAHAARLPEAEAGRRRGRPLRPGDQHAGCGRPEPRLPAAGRRALVRRRRGDPAEVAAGEVPAPGARHGHHGVGQPRHPGPAVVHVGRRVAVRAAGRAALAQHQRGRDAGPVLPGGAAAAALPPARPGLRRRVRAVRPGRRQARLPARRRRVPGQADGLPGRAHDPAPGVVDVGALQVRHQRGHRARVRDADQGPRLRQQPVRDRRRVGDVLRQQGRGHQALPGHEGADGLAQAARLPRHHLDAPVHQPGLPDVRRGGRARLPGQERHGHGDALVERRGRHRGLHQRGGGRLVRAAPQGHGRGQRHRRLQVRRRRDELEPRAGRLQHPRGGGRGLPEPRYQGLRGDVRALQQPDRGAVRVPHPDAAHLRAHDRQGLALGRRQRPQVPRHHAAADEHGGLLHGAARHDRRQPVQRRGGHAGAVPALAAGQRLHARAAVRPRALGLRRQVRRDRGHLQEVQRAARAVHGRHRGGHEEERGGRHARQPAHLVARPHGRAGAQGGHRVPAGRQHPVGARAGEGRDEARRVPAPGRVEGRQQRQDVHGADDGARLPGAPGHPALLHPAVRRARHHRAACAHRGAPRLLHDPQERGRRAARPRRRPPGCRPRRRPRLSSALIPHTACDSIFFVTFL